MSDAKDLLSEVGYQYSNGEHTRGNCLTDGCKGSSRGGLYCRACAATRLAEVTSPSFAARATALFKARMSIQGDIDDMYEELT